MRAEEDDFDADEIEELPLCSRCKYDLTGLPSRGFCPECGQRYDIELDVGLRRSMSAEERGDWIMRRLRMLLLLAAAVVIMVCAGALSMIAVTPRKPLIVGAAAAGLCVLAAAADWLLARWDDR